MKTSGKLILVGIACSLGVVLAAVFVTTSAADTAGLDAAAPPDEAARVQAAVPVEPLLLAPREVFALMQGPTPPRLMFVGSRELFELRHLPGAEWVDFNRVADLETGGEDRLTVFYCGCCSGDQEGLSGAAVRIRLKQGDRRIAHLKGHLSAWLAEGLPIEGDPSLPPPTEERSYATAEQYYALTEFAGSVQAQSQSLSGQEREAFLRQKEIDGLRLKRTIAEENSDLEKVRQIDDLLEERRTP